MNVQSPHKWWFILKSAVFGMSSSLPLLVGEDGGLLCDLVSKADLLPDHFDNKQYKESVDRPLTCHVSASLTTFAFRSINISSYLKRTPDVLVFWQLLHLVSFPSC